MIRQMMQCGVMIATAVALAAMPCMAQQPAPPPVEGAWSVEGSITAIDATTGTITVNYVFPIKILPTMAFTGPAGTGAPSHLRPTISGANLAQLLDANAPNRVRSILPSDLAEPSTVLAYSGATIIASGNTLTDATGTHNYANFADLLIAENVIVGTLQSVDLAAQTFVVAGQTVQMNPDERFTSSIVGGGGVPIEFASLAEGLGDIVTVNGYMVDGKCYCCLLETNLVGPGGVSVTRALGVAKTNQLSVVGDVAKIVPGQRVSIYDAVTNKLLGSVTVTVGALPGTGSFTFAPRKGSFVVPAKIKVVTSDGLQTTADVVFR